MTHRELAQPSGSMSEFPRPAGGGVPAYVDACGCNANTNALAAIGLAPQSEAEQTAVRSRDISLGWFTVGGGQTLDCIHSDILRFNAGTAQVVAYIPYSQPGNWAAMLPLIRLYAGIFPIVIQLGTAYNLLDNEGGVYEHFVCIAGYDDTDGVETFKILNGDDILSLGWNGAEFYVARWVSLANLISADVQGLIVVQKVGAHMGVPTGWKDSANGNTGVDGVLTASNGIEIVRGFRLWVLSSSWDPNNLPLATEASASPCNPIDATSGAGVSQLFAYLVAIWQESTNKIWSISAGSYAEYLIAHPKVAPAPLNVVDADVHQLLKDAAANS